MNRFFKFFLPVCLVAVFTACSSNDDTPELIEFPQLETVSLEAGQEENIDFVASSEWRLVSDKTWVRFLTDKGEEVAVVYGDAGAQSVTIVAKTNGHTFEDEKASLNMTMGNRTETVFEVTREAKIREIEMKVRTGFSGPFNTAERLDMAYGGSYRLGFTANYDWKLLSYPDWMVELQNIIGNAGAEVTQNTSEPIYIIDDFIPYEREGEIVVAPRSGEGDPVTFTVTYAGQDAKTLIMNPATHKNNGVMFSQDGFYCERKSEFDPYVKTDEKTVTFQITTRNMEYRMVLVECNVVGDKPVVKEVDMEGSWVSCVESPEKKGEMTLSVLSDNEDADTRSLYLYFLPPHYFEAEYNFANDFSVLEGKLTFRGRTALGMAISQEGAGKQDENEGFKIIGGASFEELLPAPVKIVDPEITEDWGTTNIYAWSFTRAEWDLELSRGFGIEVNGAQKIAMVFVDSDTDWLAIDFEWYEDDGFAGAYPTPRMSYDQLPNGTTDIYFFVPDAYGLGRDLHGVLKISKAE